MVLPSSPEHSPATTKLEDFDPNAMGLDNGNLYGLPFTADTAHLIVLGVPWEATVSYHAGTALGPDRVRRASVQIDLYDLDYPNGWRQGIFMPPLADHWLKLNQTARTAADQVMDAAEAGLPPLAADLAAVNQACEAMNQWVYSQTLELLRGGKRVGLVGGDHSVPLGYVRALAELTPEFGILHIDAHADLRQAYQGFTYSHASIMYNLLQLPQVSRLVQVGIRDVCEAEVAQIRQAGDRIVPFYDAHLKENRYGGVSWQSQCQTIVAALPERVYVSFDVDGLDPKLCPHTGTPVPGGLDLGEVFYLLRQVILSGRRIIGFDLSEVGDGEWDGNVGARIIYKLSCLMTA
ncbi:MAG: agmatinase family protein [Cyanobacteria bacterium REEB459]|nr:agmatinase family protein [Cyanobacteria bacterium REEB459]